MNVERHYEQLRHFENERTVLKGLMDVYNSIEFDKIKEPELKQDIQIRMARSMFHWLPPEVDVFCITDDLYVQKAGLEEVEREIIVWDMYEVRSYLGFYSPCPSKLID